MRVATLLLAAVLGSAGALRAQDTTSTVRPGMTEAEVRQRWGEPIAIRRINDWTYLFFANGDRHFGFLDFVMLQGGQVMDAVVRAPEHVYLGPSSSPPDRLPAFTAPHQPQTSDAPAAVTGVRVSAPNPPPQPET